MVEEFFGAIGRSVLGACARCGRFSLLALDTFRQLFRQRPSVRHTLQQMAHLGVNSLPIVMLTMLFTGMVMTVQTASEFIKYGAQSSVGGVIAIAMGRELSPVLTGVVEFSRTRAMTLRGSSGASVSSVIEPTAMPLYCTGLPTVRPVTASSNTTRYSCQVRSEEYLAAHRPKPSSANPAMRVKAPIRT